MSFAIDARVPVTFGTAGHATAGDALLLEGGAAGELGTFQPTGGDAAGCLCCASRRNAGLALSALLHARARGKIAFFRRVVAVTLTDEGRDDVAAALESDPVASACFRLTPGA